MIDYIIVLVPVCLLALAASLLAVHSQRQVAAALVLVLTAFAGLRGYVGTDTGGYHTMFVEYGGGRVDELIGVVEPVFALWLKLSAMLSDSSFVFVGGIAVLQGALLLMVLHRHEQPALFLAVYTATFFVNFHFNILRNGTAALLLLLAFAALQSGRNSRFQAYSLLSILSHYSSVLYVVPMNLAGRRLTAGLAWLLASAVVAAGVLYLFVSEARYVQYLTYFAFIDTGKHASFGLGLLALFVLYAAVFATTASGPNVRSLALLLALWYLVRLAGNYLLLVGRIEVIVNLLLLYQLTNQAPVPHRRSFRMLAMTLLVMLNLYGSLGSLRVADEGGLGGGVPGPATRRNSTYLPYKFLWEE